MVKVLSDSTCDLSVELRERYNVDIIPLHVRLGDEEHLDGIDITPEEIFAWSDQNNTTPKTSAPSSSDVIEIYKKNLEKYDQLVVFTISASMSASNNVCRLAAEELGASDRITVIDSANLSTGALWLQKEKTCRRSRRTYSNCGEKSGPVLPWTRSPSFTGEEDVQVSLPFSVPH